MKIREHTELEVYKKAFDAAMSIFELTKKFPKEETYSLTDQIRAVFSIDLCQFGRSMAQAPLQSGFYLQAFRRRRRAAETQVWLQFADI